MLCVCVSERERMGCSISCYVMKGREGFTANSGRFESLIPFHHLSSSSSSSSGLSETPNSLLLSVYASKPQCAPPTTIITTSFRIPLHMLFTHDSPSLFTHTSPKSRVVAESSGQNNTRHKTITFHLSENGTV